MVDCLRSPKGVDDCGDHTQGARLLTVTSHPGCAGREHARCQLASHTASHACSLVEQGGRQHEQRRKALEAHRGRSAHRAVTIDPLTARFARALFPRPLRFRSAEWLGWKRIFSPGSRPSGLHGPSRMRLKGWAMLKQVRSLLRRIVMTAPAPHATDPLRKRPHEPCASAASSTCKPATPTPRVRDEVPRNRPLAVGAVSTTCKVATPDSSHPGRGFTKLCPWYDQDATAPSRGSSCRPRSASLFPSLFFDALS